MVIGPGRQGQPETKVVAGEVGGNPGAWGSQKQEKSVNTTDPVTLMSEAERPRDVAERSLMMGARADSVAGVGVGCQ